MELSKPHMVASSSLFLYSKVIILLSCFNLQALNSGSCLATASTVVRGNDTDQQALLQFKAKITGDQLRVMESWNSSIHFCKWHGVTCGQKYQRVTELELELLELSGSLSPYIGNLSFLIKLNLEGNSFSNQIPQEIGGLRRLESLNLANNSISGEIPWNLSACSKLAFVSMRGNQLKGAIPASLGLLSNLKLMLLGHNSLSGSIPPSLGNLSSLEGLALMANALSGIIPEALGKLTNLSELQVEENAFSGVVPVSMFNLSNIGAFNTGGNRIQGTLPSDFAITMPHVEFFSVWGNQISGQIPVSLSNASVLNVLQLGDNRLGGKVPSLEKLDQLSILLIDRNHLGHGGEGDLNFLCTLVNDTKLEILDISQNNLGGLFPKCISNFSRTLSYLIIGNNKIMAGIPDGIGNLINLEALAASKNQFSGPIPSDFGSLQKLNIFYAHNNFLSGLIPHSIGNLTVLTELALGFNNLQGSIPSSLGNCKKLQVMDLSNNNLTGPIPPQVLGLSSLSIALDLSSNYLTGELPIEVENLKNLGEFYVSQNNLSGFLPSSLGSCVSLEKLFLDGNLFEGSIPLSLSSLRGLVELDVSNNNLSGQVPEFLVNFRSLQYLNLSFNDFEGMMPNEGVFKNTSAAFVEGNNKLCGGIPELHLPRCNSETSSNTSHRLKIVIVFVVLGVILVFSFLLIIWFRRKKEQQPTTTFTEDSLLQLSYKSILRATHGFSSQNLLLIMGCDNILAKLHTTHPELCDKVGGLLAMHIDDLRVLAPLWLSKTEEVREDRAHWATNMTGDIYGKGWISEMYGYSFGAAEAGLRHKINDDLMIYPGYTPRPGVEPILLHYGLAFSVGNWSFSKLEHHEDGIVYECERLFPEPPYPREVKLMESDPNKRRGLFLSIECINTMNEGLLLQHARNGCSKPKWSKYLSFLKSKTFAELTKPKLLPPPRIQAEPAKEGKEIDEHIRPYPKIHTVFSTECTSYFDWQSVGLMHSFHLSGQPGNITRLLSCTDEELKNYKGHDLAPTHYVPSMSRHPLTGDWYPVINKPAAVVHWLNHVDIDAEYVVILDADMILRGPITPWEFKAARGRPVSTPYEYLIGCDNELAKLHTRQPEACDKVGGVIIMHIDDLREFALLWLLKTEEVRADKAHYATNITGDIYESGWISEMYGYSFGAAELNLRHLISSEILIYPGYVPEPGVKYRVFHYGLEFKVGNWSFDKAKWREVDVVNNCWSTFPDPPDPSTLEQTDDSLLQRDLLSIECARMMNEALRLHHKRRNCPDPTAVSNPKLDTTKDITTSRKLGRSSGNDSQESSEPKAKDGVFSTLRFWIILLWVFSGVGFMLVMLAVCSRYAGNGSLKGKSIKNRRRAYTGLLKTNGRDRQTRKSDVSL